MPDFDDEYLAINLAGWDERAPAHAASADYGFDRFIADPEHLSAVVRFDLPLLGDISGLRGLHLQCHIGTDTLSLARLGARMSGLDFSGAALEQARNLAEQTATDIDYHQADAYAAVDVFGPESFDLVFTGIGALCWLPSIGRWAETISAVLRPGGRLFIREGHPVLWAIDDETTDRLVVRYPYFETAEPSVWDAGGTYVETDVEFQHNVTHEWNHGLGEVVTALLDHGMRISGLVEHRSVPWEALPGQLTRGDDDEWRLDEQPDRLPLTYTLQAIKDAAA